MKPIERVTVVGQVTEAIRAMIKERNLNENDKLPTEKELCETLEVGRSTVREAMRTLQAMGEVKFKHGKGAFVGPGNTVANEIVTKEWFSKAGIKLMDFVEIRLAIEPLSVRLAIHRASEEDIAELARIHNLFIQAVATQNALHLAKYDELFHMEIAYATHNQLMINIMESIKKEVFEMRVKSFSIPKRMAGAIKPHEMILDAFYSRNMDAGSQAMTDHIKEAYSEYVIV
jgi:Transcriptional regulators